MGESKKQFSTFHIDDLLLGIEVHQVQEVFHHQTVTPVLLAPDTIRGLINLRGQIVTVLDLRRRLDLPERPEGVVPMNVVVHDGDDGVSLLVDHIGDVVEVQEELFEPPPSTIPQGVRSLLKGVYKLSDQLLLILNTARLLDQVDPKSTAKPDALFASA